MPPREGSTNAFFNRLRESRQISKLDLRRRIIAMKIKKIKKWLAGIGGRRRRRDDSDGGV